MCRFCKKFEVSNLIPKNAYDYTILETSNFVVVPTIGALVEGWFLIIAKKHFICAGELPSSLIIELEEIKEKSKILLEPIFGLMTVFEHGPAKPNLLVGCTVDHIHIHLAPLKFNLFEKTNAFTKFNWKVCDSLKETAYYYELELSYLYLELPNGLKYIVTNEEIPSQLFRQVIAKEIGRPEEFNWRLYNHLDIVTTTLQILERSNWAKRELVINEVE